MTKTILLIVLFITFSISGYGQINSELQFNMGVNKFKQHQYVEAISIFNALLDRNEDQYQVWFYRGKSKFALGDFIGAEMDYKKSTYYKPFQPFAYHDLALVQLNSGKVFSGIKNLNRSLKQDSLNARAYYHRAIAMFQIHNFSSAQKDLEKVMKLNKYTIDAIRLRSEIYKAQEDYDLAIEDINRLIQQKYDLENDYLLRAEIHQLKEDYKKAIVDAETVCNTDSFNVDALYIKAFSLSHLKQIKESKQLINKILEVDPGHTRTLYLKASLHWQEKAFKKAEIEYEKLMELMPKNVLVLLDLAKLNAQQKYFTKSIFYIDKVKTILPQYPESYKLASQIYLRRNQYAKAEAENSLFEKYTKSTELIPKEEQYVIKEKYLSLKSVKKEDQVTNKTTKDELRLSSRVMLGLSLIENVQKEIAFSSKSSITQVDESILPFRKNFFNEGSQSSNLKEVYKKNSGVLNKNQKPIDQVLLQIEYLVTKHKFDSALVYATAQEKSTFLNSGEYNFLMGNLYWNKWEFIKQNNISESWIVNKDSHAEKLLSELQKQIIIYFENAIKQVDNPDFVYYNLALFYAQNRDGVKAIEYMEQAYLLNPNEAEISYNLGLLNYKLDKFEEACKYLSISGNLGKKQAYELISIICN
ncbi:MAG: tetratricopeptide repeat protein [Flavobacteriales bacterium]